VKVDLLETRKRRGASTRVERLYRCANGWSLGAVRGGPLDLADEGSWEIFVLDSRGIVCGDSAGFVSDETLAGAVERLARWQVKAA
jgi:hypothetical protein